MSFESILKENQDWIDATWKKLDLKLSRTAVKSRYKIPFSTKNGEHDDLKERIAYWTNGFWGGLMWLMYEETGNQEYRISAEQNESYIEKAFEKVEELDHDVGFMFHITSGVDYRLTGNPKAKNSALLAAMTLSSRYNVEGNFIRSWNKDRVGWTIIDCMMNLPLLYWASRELQDDRFKYIAVRHADMTIRDHIRADGSVNHIVVHDPATPDLVLETKGGQGYGLGSSWSRGCAWALYGFVLSYLHTKEERYLETAKKVARYFIKETEKTAWLPLLDFRQPETPRYYDSTAGAIAACGLIELAKLTTEEERETYIKSALEILKAMEKNWCDWSETEDSILQMGSVRYTHNIHIPIIYGDYFFTEAILKLKGSKFLAW